MKKLFNILTIFTLTMTLTSCSWNRPEPDSIGVLMDDYGRNGVKSFKVVTGAQGILWWGQELYQIPAWLQTGDPQKLDITTKNSGVFSIDPAYTYKALRIKGDSLVYEYRNYAKTPESFFKNVEVNLLNKRVTDAYREEARNYTTDSLMANMNQFEKQVETRLKDEFSKRFFYLETITSGLTPPKSLTDEIERTNAALQKKRTIANEIENSKMEKEKAEIDAQTNEAKSRGLTKEVLTSDYIKMLQSTDNKVIITDGKSPLILNP